MLITTRFKGKQSLESLISKVLEDDRTLGSYANIEKIQRYSLFLHCDPVQILVKTLTGRTRIIDLSLDATVLSLKQELEVVEGVRAGTTHFSWVPVRFAMMTHR